MWTLGTVTAWRAIDLGIFITTAAGRYSSPVQLVPKSDGSNRVVFDLRRLNAITKPVSYPMLDVANLSRAPQGHEMEMQAGPLYELPHFRWRAIVEKIGNEKITFFGKYGTRCRCLMQEGRWLHEETIFSSPSEQNVIKAMLLLGSSHEADEG